MGGRDVTRRRLGYLLSVAALAVLGPALVATTGSGSKGKRAGAVALLKSADGRAVARVKLTERRNGKVAVRVRARGFAPGFHGFHVHEKGLCEPPDFTTAGGHYRRGAEAHGGHAGDMPPLLVTGDGKAQLAFATDSFRIGELVAGDGSAIVIHAGRDNLANVPTRYHAHVPDASSTTFGPDPDTLKTGDAGSRFACGAVRARGR